MKSSNTLYQAETHHWAKITNGREISANNKSTIVEGEKTSYDVQKPKFVRKRVNINRFI